jgi:iron-sulfur cluster repair protein YtfE (RIC family)
MQTETLVPGTQTVNETIRRFPATVAVFKAFGIDSCCGGPKTITEAATRHGIDAAMLLEILEKAARGEPADATR